MLFQLYLKVNYKQLQLNHGLKFPKRIAIRRIELWSTWPTILIRCVWRNIFKVNPETKEIKRPFVSHKANPAAIKIHKDGRLFICYLGDFKSTGGIFAATENGDNIQDIIEDLSTEYCIDDMVFDSKGGFYLQILEDTLPTR